MHDAHVHTYMYLYNYIIMYSTDVVRYSYTGVVYYYLKKVQLLN